MIRLESITHQDGVCSLYTDNSLFQLTTDSVLLADFVKLHSRCRLLVDFGTGLGVIPLLLSMRSDISMIGFEIQSSIAALAQKSVLYNQLEDQITIISDKVQNCLQYLKVNSVDVVVCNPPYFKAKNQSIISSNQHKAFARHEMMLTFLDVVDSAKKILKNQGKLFFIQRTERFLEIVQLLQQAHLEPKRVQFVYYPHSNTSIVFLMEAVKNGKAGLTVDSPLILN